jgi:protein TonB
MAKPIVTVALAALALAACSKGDEVTQRRPQPTRIEAPEPQAAAPSADIDPALKERLARQEAASRMFEKNVLEPPAPKEPRAAPGKPEPAKAPPAEPKTAAAPPKSATPPPPIAPAPVAAAPVTPAPAPAKAAPTQSPAPAKAEPPPRTDVAAAKPSAAAPSRETRLVTRIDPEFPREAVQSGVERGNVKVRIWLEESGGVSRVEVLEANPRRIFDRAVVREGAAGRSVETEVDFKR